MNWGLRSDIIVSGIPTWYTIWSKNRGISCLAIIVSYTGIVIGYLDKRSINIVTIL
jgi:hypothetical protein